MHFGLYLVLYAFTPTPDSPPPTSLPRRVSDLHYDPSANLPFQPRETRADGPESEREDVARSRQSERVRERCESDSLVKGARSQEGEIIERERKGRARSSSLGEAAPDPGEGSIVSPPSIIRTLHSGLGALREASLPSTDSVDLSF